MKAKIDYVEKLNSGSVVDSENKREILNNINRSLEYFTKEKLSDD
jgi:hypothetical protein